MSHTIELDRKTFEAARKLIGCAELQSVRLSRCRVEINPQDEVTERNPVTLTLKSKGAGKRRSDSEIEVEFDFNLSGVNKEKDVRVILISLKLIGTYSVPASLELDEAEIKAFAMSNGMLNAWPYWREFVQSISTRAALPPLTVPLFRIQHKE